MQRSDRAARADDLGTIRDVRVRCLLEWKRLRNRSLPNTRRGRDVIGR
jgi:hypothetical protein